MPVSHQSTLLCMALLAACASTSSPRSRTHGIASVHGSTHATEYAHETEPPGASAPPTAVAVHGGLPMLELGLTSFGAATDGEKVYVLGGYFGTPHRYSMAGQSDGFIRVKLDGSDGAWESLPGAGKLQSVALSSHAGGLYRTGGMRARNEEGTPADLHSIAEAARFDTASGSWRGLPDMPEARSSHQAAWLDGKLYVLGGWQLTGGARTGKWHDNGAVLDTTGPEPSWTSLPVPFRRRALAVAAAAGRVVALGGLTPEGQPSTDVHIFDPATGAWKAGPAFPGAGFGVAAIGSGDAIYASGSDGVLHALKFGQVPTWSEAGQLAFPRFFHQLVTTPGGEVLALGGIAGMKRGARVRHVEAITTGEDAGLRELGWTVGSPMDAKNRHATVLIDDSLYFFGGNRSLGQHDFGAEFFSAQGHQLNLLSMQWRAAAPFPEQRQSMVSRVSEDGTALVIGGFGHPTPSSAETKARTQPGVHVYNPVTNAWTSRDTTLPTGRTQFGLTEHEGHSWIFGGLDYDPSRPRAEHFKHDLRVLTENEEGAFEDSGLKLPGQRRAFAGTRVGDRYYMIGGMRDGFQLVESCEYFDFSRGEFGEFTCPPRARLSGQAVEVNGKIYLIGGSSRGDDGKLHADTSLEVFDPETNTWSRLHPQLPIEGRHLRAFDYKGRLLLVNAHSEDPELKILLVDVQEQRAIPADS